MASLERYNIRVSVTDSGGQAQAFLISRNGKVERDMVGPVVDLFSGKIPLAEGDRVIYTETYPHDRGTPISGETPLRVERWPFVEVTLEDGRTGVFIVDIGAVTTVVDADFLPEGQEIEETQMTSYSSAGVKKLKYAPEGATGAVQTILGKALLPRFALDGLVFEDVTVDVMKGLSEVFKRPLAGILGLDMIARTRVLSLLLGGEQPSMTMSPEPLPMDGEFLELPMTIIRGHVVVDGMVGGARVSFILDTGAPESFLDALAADAAGVAVDASSGEDGGGLDGGRLSILDSEAAVLRLASTAFEDICFKVSAFPLFASLRGGGQNVGLLGVSFFARFDRVDIDFEDRVVRFFTARG